MSWVITPSNLLVDDQDALTYLAVVEAADGQALESGVRLAVNAFVKGCKADGIWPSIRASCILAGARTLTGALVPLAGTAPTSVSFVSGDYNRKTGLVGDGSTKYLDSNRACNADPQNNTHFSVYKTSGLTTGAMIGSLGAITPTSTHSYIDFFNSFRFINRGVTAAPTSASSLTGFFGSARSASDAFNYRIQASTLATSGASGSASANNYFLFNRSGGNNYFDASRLAFYSIGESLNLALLDARVTTLINAFAAAIP